MWFLTQHRILPVLLIVVLILSGWYLSGEYLVGSVSTVQPKITTLYNKRLYKPACSIGCANCRPTVPLCAELDNDSRAGVLKEVEFDVSVPSDGGYLALYFDDKEDYLSYYGTNFRGGFKFENVYFKPSGSNEKLSLHDGLRVWTSGKIVFEFDQPYSGAERLKMNYHFLVHFLPHSNIETLAYRGESQKGRQDALDYAKQRRFDVTKLCSALGSSIYVPAGCSGGKTGDARVVKQNKNRERDLQQGGGARFPIQFVLDEEDYFVFAGEPTTIRILEAFDADGLCSDFEFEWENRTARLRIDDFDKNDDDWSLFFTPKSVGTYTLRVRAIEFCDDLGSQVSDWQIFRVHAASRSADFRDVNDVPGYQRYLMELYSRGVMTGYADKTMRPKNLVNRAEFLKMLFEVIDYKIPRGSFTAAYDDVRGNEWFAKYIFEGNELGIIQGYPDGFFRPASAVNRVEALKMAMNMTDIEVKDSLMIEFGDVFPTDWFSRYVQTAYREGILEAEQNRNFFPGEFITRAEAAKIIVRTFIEPVNRLNQVQLNKVKN